MPWRTQPTSVHKLITGIPGFELISYGGLPENRTCLVAGTSGSAKTVFAAQFLAEGIRLGQPGVFVTFEESPADLRKNMEGFDWPIQVWESENRWAFVDVSPQPGEPSLIVGGFDLGALIARIELAVGRVGAKRVALDSLGGIFAQVEDSSTIRWELFRVAQSLRKIGVTALITIERTEELGPVSRFGVEEFVADNVIILRNNSEMEKRRRTIEILKFRGTPHQKGDFPFTVSPHHGIVIIPLSAIELKQKSSDLRLSSGVIELDTMCGGGFFRDSVILVSGATGTGKTLFTSQFVAGGIDKGERSLLFAFEESHDQLFRNAKGWGIDFNAMERAGQLRIVCEYPEATSLEDQLISMRAAIDEFKPQRVAVDSLSALERVGSLKTFREFAIGLTSFVKDRNIVGLFTATTASLMGGTSITETHISTITDSIILLRYVEFNGEMRRGLTILKMRGSMHDKDIREFMIDGTGMHIGKPFRNVNGILSGHLSVRPMAEMDRLDSMFRNPNSGQ